MSVSQKRDKTTESLSKFVIPKRKRQDDEETTVNKEYTPVIPDDYNVRSDKIRTDEAWPMNTTAYNHLSYSPPVGVVREKPKVPNGTQSTAYHDRITNADDTLPKELTAMFQPLYCKLCSVQLSSNIMAKLHYNSKNHEKKIRNYLVEYSERTGEPLHKRARVENGPNNSKKQGEHDPKWFRCDACDLPLTGRLHAESHYMGKSHQKVIARTRDPSGSGFYNANGQWVRMSLLNLKSSRSDNFGKDFVLGEATAKVDDLNSRLPSERLRCELCNVSATSVVQMEMHYNGQKHKKKLKQQGMSIDDNSESGGAGCVVVPNKEPPKDNILTSVVNSDDGVKDFSVYRTPTGNFYCKTCDVTMNSEVQFKQHLPSKSHLKKTNAIKA